MQGHEKNKLYLAMSYGCNNNCLFCVVDSNAKKNISLSTKQTIEFLKKLEEKGEMKDIKFIELSGGEPTLRKDLFYVVDYISYRYPEIRFGMLSNGRGFANPYLAEKVSQYNLDWIYVPLHGHNAELHEIQTQAPGSFNETVLGVHNLLEYRVKTSLKTVITDINYMNLPDIIEFVANEFPECKIFTFAGIDIWGAAARNKEKVAASFSNIIPYIQKSIDIAKKHGMVVDIFNIPPCLFEEKYIENVRPQCKDLLVLKTPDKELRNIQYQYGTTQNCKECILESTCSGAWFSYFKEFGAHEIKPIKGNQYASR